MPIVDDCKAIEFLMFIFYKLKLRLLRCLNFDLLTFLNTHLLLSGWGLQVDDPNIDKIITKVVVICE